MTSEDESVTILGIIWGALLCPLYFALVDRHWLVASAVGLVTLVFFVLWLKALHERVKHAGPGPGKDERI